MKSYLIHRAPTGTLQLTAQAEVIDRDSKGRVRGAHIETEIRKDGLDCGNASKESHALALAVMSHYYGSDPAALAEAERKAPIFLNAFLIHQKMPPGSRYEISSEVLDKFFNLQ